MNALADGRPGLAGPRLARLVDDAVQRCALDLRGVSVLTEAATGPYAVTPVLAAAAGASVVALTASTRYGTLDDVRAVTLDLAERLGVTNRITVTDERSPKLFAEADVITNSGHVRPICGDAADAIRPDAVLSLMFEAWEIQAGRLDLDLDGLRARGVRIAGTNERHPHVDVFSFLGPMAVVQLADAGVSAYHGTIAVLCDNPFSDYLHLGLLAAGARAVTASNLADLLAVPAVDALIVALRPTGASVLSADALRSIALHWPDATIVQFWGDVDRSRCAELNLACWPTTSPGTGHMGVLPSRLGPEPIVRLQAGGLKVAQVLLKPPQERTSQDLAYLDPLD
jgi:hypothetical protein